MTDNTYIQILFSILSKKENLLEQLLEVTLLQEEYLSLEQPDVDNFEKTISQKEIFIQEMLRIDDGFEKVFENVRKELNENKGLYREDILRLQHLIKVVTELSLKLQTLEKKNKDKLEVYLSTKKREIKNFKISSNTASNYYKNMTNQYQGQSYFLDKKK